MQNDVRSREILIGLASWLCFFELSFILSSCELGAMVRPQQSLLTVMPAAAPPMHASQSSQPEASQIWFMSSDQILCIMLAVSPGILVFYLEVLVSECNDAVCTSKLVEICLVPQMADCRPQLSNTLANAASFLRSLLGLFFRVIFTASDAIRASRLADIPEIDSESMKPQLLC